MGGLLGEGLGLGIVVTVGRRTGEVMMMERKRSKQTHLAGQRQSERQER